MSMIRLILKEIGGRAMDAAGSIRSKNNMYEGSENNAPSDKLMNTGNANPVVTQGQGEGAGDENKGGEVATEGTSDTTADVDSSDLSSGEDIGAETSDANAKTEVKSVSFKYQPMEGGRLRGILKNVDFSKTPSPKTQGAGGGMPGAGGAGGAGGEGAEGGEAADGADAADAADAGDAADAMG